METEQLDWAEPLLERWVDPLVPVVGTDAEAWSDELLPHEHVLSVAPEFRESGHQELLDPAEGERWGAFDLP